MKPKSMRSLKELLAEVASGKPEISESEERLIDLITYEQKGERFGRFAEEKTENPEDDSIKFTPAAGTGRTKEEAKQAFTDSLQAE
jgi:hypothetical protein